MNVDQRELIIVTDSNGVEIGLGDIVILTTGDDRDTIGRYNGIQRGNLISISSILDENEEVKYRVSSIKKTVRVKELVLDEQPSTGGELNAAINIPE